MDEIRVLQIGDRDWREIYTLPGEADFRYAERFEEASGKPYDIVFWDREPEEGEIMPLHRATKAHTLFVTEKVEPRGQSLWLYEGKKGRRLAEGEIQFFLDHELRTSVCAWRGISARRCVRLYSGETISLYFRVSVLICGWSTGRARRWRSP